MLSPNNISSHTGGFAARAFTLVELLTVMGIIVLLASFTGPALRSLTGAGTVNRAVADFSSTLELARVYAMANHTYVRVVMSPQSTGNGKSQQSLVVLTISAANGTLTSDPDSNSSSVTTSDPASPVQWPAIGKAIVLENIIFAPSLNTSSSSAPSTDNDDVAFTNDAPFPGPQSNFAYFKRAVSGFGSVPLTFTSVVQFSPSGEARTGKDRPSRYIKIGCDEPQSPSSSAPRNRNPFLLRVSGVNGQISILRKEDL